MTQDWNFVINGLPPVGQRCLLVTTSKLIISGDWHNNGWRTEWSKWEYDTATNKEKLSLLPKNTVIAWMPFPPLPDF